MERSAPIPRLHKSVATVSTKNNCALVQKLRVIDEKCSEMFNEVGARLRERQREKTEREDREEEREGRGEVYPSQI